MLGLTFRFVLLLVIQGLVILALAAILPGVKTLSFQAAVLVAAAMALINTLLWPVVIRVALPLTMLTFGLGVAALQRRHSRARASTRSTARGPRSAAIWRSRSALALVSMLVAPLLDVDGDAQHLRVVRRRVRHGTQGKPQRCPGRDPVRDRRSRRGGAARGRARRARADDRALARRREPQGDRLGVRSLLPDRREPGRPAARQQLGHARVPLV